MRWSSLLVLVGMVGCAPLGPRPGTDPFDRRSSDEQAGCATVVAENRRFETAVVYDRRRRVATVEGKMAAEFTLCRAGLPELTVHFIGGGDLRPHHDGSISAIGLIAQDLVMVIGLTDLQSHVRAKE